MIFYVSRFFSLTLTPACPVKFFEEDKRSEFNWGPLTNDPLTSGILKNIFYIVSQFETLDIPSLEFFDHGVIGGIALNGSDGYKIFIKCSVVTFRGI